MKKTQKAITLNLFGLATLFSLVTVTTRVQALVPEVAAAVVEKSDEDKALDILKNFLTNPDYKVTESFKQMCCRAADLFEKSSKKVFQDLAKVLKEICNKKNLMEIGTSLRIYQDTINNHVGKVLDFKVLAKRLNESLKIQ